MSPDASLTAVGRYRIVRSLGVGSRGHLYLAVDPMLDREVAVRILPQLPAQVRSRVERALRSRAAIHHAGLAAIHDIGDYDNRLFIVRAFAAGRTFAEIIAAKDPVPLSLRLEWIEQVCNALDHVHRRGAAGVALKSEDVVVDGSRIVIVDAGLREILEDAANAEAASQGTDGEAARDPRRDIFFTGTMLCELVTFRRFVSASSEAGILRLAHESLEPALVKVIERTVQPDPAHRYQTFKELASDLRRVRGAPDDAFEETVISARAPAAPSAPEPAAIPSGVRASLQRRRQQAIESLLARADRALLLTDYQQARQLVDEALLFDLDHPGAALLLQRIEVAEEREQRRMKAERQAAAEREALRRIQDEAQQEEARRRTAARARAEEEERRRRAEEAQRERTRADARVPPEARRVDENVRFTVYRPAVMMPQQWYPLLVFTHLGERRPDAPPSEMDPATAMRNQVHTLLGSAAASYSRLAQDASIGIPHEALLRITPSVPGLVFNPPEYSFMWVESVHRADFKVRADRSLEGRFARGTIDVRLGLIPVARVTVAIPIETRAPAQEPPVEDVVQPYRRVFASYSHKDTAVVRQFERYARGIGDSYMRDVIDLRAGEIWDQRLMAMIDAADVFQLFWSSNAMRSRFVRQEWEHALTVDKPHFVRPLYWETPFPEAEGLPPPELRARHFANVGIADVAEDSTTSMDAEERTARMDAVVAGPKDAERLDDALRMEQASAPAPKRSFVLPLILALLVLVLLASLLFLAR